MNRKGKCREAVELDGMARKLGLEFGPEGLRAALGEGDYADAVSRCNTCDTTVECQFFLQREPSAVSNQHWWAKEFCANAEPLLHRAQIAEQGG